MSDDDLTKAIEFHQSGDFNRAILLYRGILDGEPKHAGLLFNLALALQQSGDLGEAVDRYRQTLAEAPAHLDAANNLAICLIDLGRPAEAVEILRGASADHPGDAELLNNLGNALQKSGRMEDAAATFKKATAIDPENQTILANLARILLRLGDYEDGLTALAKAHDLDPENGAISMLDALALPVIPRSADQMEAARARLMERLDDIGKSGLDLDDPLNDVGVTNFFAAYHGRDDRRMQENIAQIYADACPDLLYEADHCRIKRKTGNGKIRIGFVSAHFGGHTIAKLNRGLIKGLSRHGFEVSLFCIGPESKELNSLAEAVDDIFFLPASLSNVQKSIEDAVLDILYYPDIGMEPLTYFLAFSRLAPVQCVGWGHPVTTGLPTMDYFLSSSLIEPEVADHYTEELVQLPVLPTDYRPPVIPEVIKSRAEMGLSQSATLYICPQSLFKFHPDFDLLAKDILAADGDGEIILIEGQQPSWTGILRRRLEQSVGKDAARIHFIPRLGGEDFLHLLANADVILDTPHFCGGNSSFEAFALGQPIVTLDSAYMRGRVTAGLYRQMGLPDLIAGDQDAYIATALSWANNSEIRARVVGQIRAAAGRIFNVRQAVEEHEKFFEEALRRVG